LCIRGAENENLHPNDKPQPKIYTELIEKAVEEDADAYHAHEIWSLYVAIEAKKKTGSRVVYDVHECWSAIPGWRGRMMAAYEKKALRHTDCAICANHITRGYLLRHRSDLKTEVVYNCPPHGLYRQNGTWTLCHEGKLVPGKGRREIPLVARRLNETLLIVGEANPRIDQSDVHTTGWLPYERIWDEISKARIGLIHINQTPINMLSGPPHKLFNYMKCGLPIVALHQPETTRIIEETGCGIVTNSLEEMIRATRTVIENERLAESLAENSRMAHEEYNWSKMEKRLIRAYEEMG